MTIEIDRVDARYSRVKFRMRTGDDRTFFLVASVSGFEFHSDESSSGALNGDPILKSVDEIFAWIEKDRNQNSRKEFGQRTRVQPKPPRSPNPPTSKSGSGSV